MANITVVVDIDVVQKATGLTISDAQAIEVTDDGIKWNGDIVILSNGEPLRNFNVKQVLNQNKSATGAELDAQAQADHVKNYNELTLVESRVVQTTVLATKMVTALNDTATTGVTIADPATFIAGIVGAFAAAE